MLFYTFHQRARVVFVARERGERPTNEQCEWESKKAINQWREWGTSSATRLSALLSSWLSCGGGAQAVTLGRVWQKWRRGDNLDDYEVDEERRQQQDDDEAAGLIVRVLRARARDYDHSSRRR